MQDYCPNNDGLKINPNAANSENVSLAYGDASRLPYFTVITI